MMFGIRKNWGLGVHKWILYTNSDIACYLHVPVLRERAPADMTYLMWQQSSWSLDPASLRYVIICMLLIPSLLLLITSTVVSAVMCSGCFNTRRWWGSGPLWARLSNSYILKYIFIGYYRILRLIIHMFISYNIQFGTSWTRSLCLFLGYAFYTGFTKNQNLFRFFMCSK